MKREGLMALLVIMTLLTGCGSSKNDADYEKMPEEIGEAMVSILDGSKSQYDVITEASVDDDQITAPNEDYDIINSPSKEDDEYSANDEKSSTNDLVGTWFCTMSSGDVGFSVMLEFKDDGTFVKALGSVAGYSYSATSFEGEYRIKGDKIIFYNQKKSTAYASSWEELWEMAYTSIKDIPAEDEEKTFELLDESTLLIDATTYERID